MYDIHTGPIHVMYVCLLYMNVEKFLEILPMAKWDFGTKWNVKPLVVLVVL